MVLQQPTLTIALQATCMMGVSSRSGKVHNPWYKHLTAMESHSRPAQVPRTSLVPHQRKHLQIQSSRCECVWVFLFTLQQHSVPQELKSCAWKSCEVPSALTLASVKKMYVAILPLPTENVFLKSVTVGHAMDRRSGFSHQN